jgi:hypothetical protein
MRSTFAIAVFLLIGMIGMSVAAQNMQGSIKISNEDLGQEDASVLVSVLKAGAMLKSSDCTSNHVIDWENIPEGDYEVKFEAAGKQTVIKKIHVSAGETTTLSAKLPEGKGSVAYGGGPSILEMEVRLKKVEAALLRLQPRIQKK